MHILYVAADQASSQDKLASLLTSVTLIASVLAVLAGCCSAISRRLKGRSCSLPLIFGFALGLFALFLPEFVGSFARAMDSFFEGTDEQDYSGDTSPSSTPTSSPTSDTASPSSTPAPHHTDHPTHVPWAWIGFGLVVIVAVIIVAALAWWLNIKRREQAAKYKEKYVAAAAARKARRDLEAQWPSLHKRLADITSRWDVYESDPTLFLQQPAIRDMSVPEVASAIRSLMTARNLRLEKPPADLTVLGDSTYAKAITDAEVDVQRAIETTRKMARTGMDPHERELLTEAQNMLARALDASATPAERNLAYDRLRKLVDKLHITMPETTREAIEQRHLRLIEA